jgi:hypothetical protein
MTQIDRSFHNQLHTTPYFLSVAVILWCTHVLIEQMTLFRLYITVLFGSCSIVERQQSIRMIVAPPKQRKKARQPMRQGK